MAIIKQYHQDTNTTYVYESESYWDEEKKQPRSHRKCIGKIDPDTGEIVPTGKRGRKKKAPVNDSTSQVSADIKTAEAECRRLSDDLIKKEREIKRLTSEISDLKSANSNLKARNRELESAVSVVILKLSKVSKA